MSERRSVTVDTVALGRIIEEALNDIDETELTSVINSLTQDEVAAILALVPEQRGGVYALTPAQWEDISGALQREPKP